MARIFLDANYFIDLVEQRREIEISQFLSHALFLSPLSLHVLIYVYRYKIPNKNLAKITRYFSLVSLNEIVTQRALLGPTDDFEDNLQLHSAAQAKCDFFLTHDKKVLRLGYFGNTQIVQEL